CDFEHAQEVPEFYTRYGHFFSASLYAVTPEQRQRSVDGFFVAAASSAVLTERLDAYSSGVSYEAIKDGCFARFYAEASEQPKGSADAIEACRRLAHYADDNSGWQKKGIDALAANMKGLEPKACLNVCVEIEKNEPLDSKLSAFATCQFMLALLRIDNLADRAKAQVEAIRKVRDEKKSPSFLVAYVATEGLPCCADAMVSVEGKREAWTWVARYATKDALRSSARARIAELDAVEKPVRIEPENKQARAFLDKFDFK
ncbi:MAG: hypothetical protein PHE27_02350, partial [Alphaproteobacteria bacterium]|nr:hypothetical protein [Alphaproteobacteria bacterium]